MGKGCPRLLATIGIGLFMASAQAAPAWHIPTSAPNWQTVYDGYGSVTFSAQQGIVLQPQTAASADDTHAALVLLRPTLLQPQRDFILTLTATTERQLRQPSPNPWEVFWVYFNFRTDAAGRKSTNYFLIKPNGVELGRANDELAQTYLYTAAHPTLPVGQVAHWRLVKLGRKVTVWINGTKVMAFSGAVYDVPGAIALYCEDARVRVQDVVLQPLVRPAPPPFKAAQSRGQGNARAAK